MSLDATFVKGMSKHEFKFAALWDEAGGGPLEKEFKFHPERKWRFDLARPDIKFAIELEGGIYGRQAMRHSRGKGFEQDCEKYLAALELGWSVARLTERQINAPTVERLIKLANARPLA